MQKQAIIGSTIIDGTGSDPLRNGTILIEDGKIVEQGTRNELLALDGRFANLWKLQGSVSTDGPS